MPSKRKDRAARPPANAGEWSIRFASNAAGKGWDELSAAAGHNLARIYDSLLIDPRAVLNATRQGRLKGTLGRATVGGAEHEQWQFEVTGGGRIWYVVDDDRRTVWLTLASPGHPKETD